MSCLCARNFSRTMTRWRVLTRLIFMVSRTFLGPTSRNSPRRMHHSDSPAYAGPRQVRVLAHPVLNEPQLPAAASDVVLPGRVKAARGVAVVHQLCHEVDRQFALPRIGGG